MLAVVKKASLQWLGIYNLIGIVFTTLYLWLFETVDLSKLIIGIVIIIFGFVLFIYSNETKQIKINLKQHVLLTVMAFSFCCSSLLHWKNLNLNFPALLVVANQEVMVFLVGLVLMCKQTNLIL